MVIGGNRKWNETVKANWIRERTSVLISVPPCERVHTPDNRNRRDPVPTG
jgi:hypothetical protein